MAAVGGGGIVAAEDRGELGYGVQAGAGVGESRALGVQGFEVGQGFLDGGVAIPREQVEGLAAGDACECGEIKAVLDKDLQQVGVLGREGGW